MSHALDIPTVHVDSRSPLSSSKPHNLVLGKEMNMLLWDGILCK